MPIYAISDLHLSLGSPKPMDVFGDLWRDHDKKIAEHWDATVSPEDTVLVAGDSSWGLRYEDALPDLDYIARRPGHKILIRGNHDYWWRREQTTHLSKLVDPSITLMQGKAVTVGNTGITGTRGWRVEQEDPEASGDKVMKRELAFLERGLKEMPGEMERRIVMLHYPPFDIGLEPNEFADMLQAYRVDILIYGHIHSGLCQEGNVNGVQYRLVSVDHVDFGPVLIA
jgi:uncharacterized protein